ncbi:hypothetical protein BpHYR1_035865 [Brachionus plicatilis]|uniref:HAT C-terminal dimerisation domain-containing protein n=1 Tax=Brachionus plicatilis TaxID=10195 RepID=A0A3M7PWL1_BRAPC|nr:hypothetical protein BpHYR1_035865 [Brachionus plicatilis]
MATPCISVSTDLVNKKDNEVGQTEGTSEIIELQIRSLIVEFFTAISKFATPNSDPKLRPNSTASFWKKNSFKFPLIKELAMILYNISAFMERFYSVGGNVCKTKCGNFSHTTIIPRSVLFDIKSSMDKTMCLGGKNEHCINQYRINQICISFEISSSSSKDKCFLLI